MELNSEVLSSNSELFAGLISQYRKGAVGSGSSGSKMCRIEVPDVENLSVFREAIELMFEDDDITKRLFRIGVYRVIDVLEVSAHFPFFFPSFVSFAFEFDTVCIISGFFRFIVISV